MENGMLSHIYYILSNNITKTYSKSYFNENVIAHKLRQTFVCDV